MSNLLTGDLSKMNCPTVASEYKYVKSTTLSVSQPEMLALLNDEAPESMAYMLVTCDVSHVPILLSKAIASLNMYIISIT